MGFDVELVDKAAKKEANVCPHCKLILEEPIQTDEGIRLCKSCLHDIKSKPGGACSCCGIEVAEGQYYPDRAALREVNVILVFCRHKKFGCKWQGKLADFKGHVTGCEFAGVSCPNAGCKEMVLSNQLQAHLAECLYRQVTCNYCQEKLIAKDLEAHHSSSCEMYPVDCSRCGERVSHRHQLADHLLHSCRLEECHICNSLVDRKTSKNAGDLSTTADDSLTGVKPQSGTPTGGQGGRKSGSRSRQKQQKKGSGEKTSSAEEGQEGEEEGGYHLGNPTAIFRHMQTLASQQGKLETELSALSQTTETRLSEVATGGSRGNRELDEGARELIGRLEEQVRMFSRQMEDERQRRVEVEQRLKRITNDLESVQRLASSSVAGGGGGGGVGKGGGRGWEGGGSVESRLMMLEQRTEQQERETSTLKVNMSELELQLQASLASTHNGSFLWRIPEVARRRRDAIDERITSIYSPPFYSGRNGYKMCIRAYLNGDGSGYKTHFSVFFVLMRGEFDPLLKWPFEYKVSLILVDQEQRKHIVQTFKPTAESSSFKRPTSDMNVASGCPQFSKLSVLDNPSYVKDDVLYLKCIIDTSRIFHP